MEFSLETIYVSAGYDLGRVINNAFINKIRRRTMSDTACFVSCKHKIMNGFEVKT